MSGKESKLVKNIKYFLGIAKIADFNKLNHSVLLGFTELFVVAYYFFRKQNSNFSLVVLLYI